MTDKSEDYLERALRVAFPEAPRNGNLLHVPPLSTEHAAPIARAVDTLPNVPGYSTLGMVGKGGMGFVVRAEEDQLGREVALKFLHERHLQDSTAVSAFLLEAKISAKLQHPGVVPVHGAGVDAEGRPFFSMRLVKGDTLAVRLSSRSSVAENRLEFLSIFQRVCDVLAYAHSEGVCHLDLKPANIIIGAYGEVMVMDWGLSLVTLPTGAEVAPEAGGTVRRIVGTPGYMAPEQATGQSSQLGPQTDVFALGAVLTEILTGQPPYAGDVPEEVFLAASRGWLEEARGRLRACGAEPELLRLAESCLALRPSERPASAAHLSRGVSSYLTSLEERARQSAVQLAESRLMALNARRERRLAIALASVMVLAALVGSVLWLALDGAKERRTRSDVDHVLALASRAELLLERAKTYPGRSAELLRDALGEARAAYARTVSAALPAPYKDRLTELVAVIEEAEDEDQRIGVLLQSLESIHEHQAAGIDEESRERAYESAFELAGLNPFSGTPERVAHWLRTNRTQNEIIRHMDDWLHVRRLHRGVSVTDKLVELINGVDSDAWRVFVRRRESERQIADLVKESERPETLARSADSVLLLALSLRRLGALAEAKGLLARATMVHPGHYDLHHEYGILLRRGGGSELPEAVRQFSMAVALRPKSAHAHLDLAQALMQSQRMEEAKLSLEVAERLDPLDAAPHHYRGVMAYLKNARSEARRHLEKALSLDPKYGLSHAVLGSIANLSGDLDQSIAHYMSAAEQRPFDHALRKLLAHSLAMAGKDGAAVREFSRTLEEAGGDASDWYRYGQLLRLVDPTAARGAFKRATERDVSFVEAWIQWGFQDYDAMDMDGAKVRFEKARSLIAAGAVATGLPLEAAERDADACIRMQQILRSLDGVDVGETIVDDRWAHAAAAMGDFQRALHFLKKAPADVEGSAAARISAYRRRARICFLGALAAGEHEISERQELVRLGAEAVARALDLFQSMSSRVSPGGGGPSASSRALAQMLLGLSRDPALKPVWDAKISGPKVGPPGPDLPALRGQLESLAGPAGAFGR